jgi:endonuclease/exonuclease/phosphatase family metal-dependent hydrolase
MTSRARSLLLLLRAIVAIAALGCDAQNYPDPEGPRYAGLYDPLSADPPGLHVVTFNVEFAREIDRAIFELTTNEDLRAADIVLLQEMDAEGTDRIAAALGFHYVTYPATLHREGRDFGNAVLSRWPITDDWKLVLPHASPSDGRIRAAVAAIVAMPGEDLLVYSFHGETPWLGPRGRLDQVLVVLDDASEHELRCIAGGDFNTLDPRSGESTAELFEARGFTWPTRSIAALDHIFVRGFDASAAGSTPSEASDHEPVWIALE